MKLNMIVFQIFFALGVAGCSPTNRQSEMAAVIEVAKFRKKAGVSEADFLAAIRSIDTFAKDQPGFISREVGPDGKGGWIDVVRWRDRHAADSAMKAAEKSEICASAFSMLDPKFEEMNHITVAHRFNK